MESLLQIIVFLSIIKFTCKATFYRNYRGILFFAILAGTFAYIIHPFVIRNNIQLFDGILSEKAKITDLALIVTAEAISGIMVSIAILQNHIRPEKRIWIKFLKLSPTILITGTIFYIELKTFYSFFGFSFRLIALITSVGLFLAIAIISLAIKYFLPKEAMRNEFKFLINALLLIIAIMLNAGLANYNRGNYNMEMPLSKLLVFLILLFGIGIIGYFIQKSKNKGKLKILHKWI